MQRGPSTTTVFEGYDPPSGTDAVEMPFAYVTPSYFETMGVRVVEGQDVVKAILAAPTSPTLGEGAMKGQMLDPAVKIVKAERVED